MIQSSDYEHVERAIRFLQENAGRNPHLAEIAAASGLSEFHFQRLFSRWAGISPKRFVQFLTLQHAKTLLLQSRSLLETTYAAGLSSPGRLHDLFVTIESVTPGEYRSGGRGLRIASGIHETPFGDALIATTSRGLCGMFFVQNGDVESSRRELARCWPHAEILEDATATASLAHRIFSAATSDSVAPISVLVRGTNFQINVWRALLAIPLGAVVSYEALAAHVGQPSASRAVGNAVGRNPVSYLIPCHRVIRKTGEFGNYGGGIERKRAMLAWEAAIACDD